MNNGEALELERRIRRMTTNVAERCRLRFDALVRMNDDERKQLFAAYEAIEAEEQQHHVAASNGQIP